MPDAAFMTATVQGAVPDAEVHPTDLGGGDHWFVVVVSPAFEGQRPLQRQRPILDAFTPHIHSGTVHALDLKCITPAELEERGMPRPFRPHEGGGGTHPGAWSRKA